MSGLKRAIAALRADVAALRRRRGSDWRVERVDTGDWLTSGHVLTSSTGVAVFVHDEAPSNHAWESAFSHLRHRGSTRSVANQARGAVNLKPDISLS